MSPGSDASFRAVSIVARSGSDVWVTGTSGPSNPQTAAPEAWHYDGSSWTDQSPGLSPHAQIRAAALGSNGILYIAGRNGTTQAGMIWSYDGSQWTDLTPANSPYQYNAVAVTAGGTLIAGGGGGGSALQERSGPTWTAIPLSQPVSIAGISVAPGGTVYAVGQATGNQPVLIQQQSGAQSAAVLAAPAAKPATAATVEVGVVASGSGDVWLLGQDEPPNGSVFRPWITHFDGSRFTEATTPNSPGSAYAITGGAQLASAVLAYGSIQGGPGQVNDFDPRLLSVCPVQVTDTTITPSTKRTAIGSQMF